MTSKHIGSSFEEFLKDEGIQDAATAHAIKHILAWLAFTHTVKPPGEK